MICIYVPYSHKNLSIFILYLFYESIIFFFFKIWVYTSIILIIIINRAHWPNMHTCTIQLGLSSSQTKKSSTFTACWASAWAWAFAFLLVCEKAKVRKPWTHWSIPQTTSWTDGVNFVQSVNRVVESTNESPSNCQSTPLLAPMSCFIPILPYPPTNHDCPLQEPWPCLLPLLKKGPKCGMNRKA